MNTAMQMIGTKAKSTFSNAIKRLVEYVRKGEIDKGRSRELCRPIYKPNRYRILVDKPKVDEQSVDVTEERSLVDVSYMLFDAIELKRVIKRTEFEGR